MIRVFRVLRVFTFFETLQTQFVAFYGALRVTNIGHVVAPRGMLWHSANCNSLNERPWDWTWIQTNGIKPFDPWSLGGTRLG